MMPTKRSQEFMDLKHGNDKKASKPLIEKRRRARINYSLSLLKALVIDSKTESTRQTKLEKADILEMTVQYLREIKKGQISVTSLDTRYAKKTFESGYMECVQQVELFLATLTNPNLAEVEVDLKNRLKDHLWQCLQDKANLDESSQVDVQNRTPSPDQQSNSSSPITSFFASNASSSQNGRSDNLFFENNLPQNDTPLKTIISNKINYVNCEADLMNMNANASKPENHHLIHNNNNGSHNSTLHQVAQSSEVSRSNYSSNSGQETFTKTRFNPSPNTSDKSQPPPYPMNPHSPSNSGDCSNKNNYSKDCNNYHNTSHYNADNSTIIHSNSQHGELRKSSSKSKSELSYNQIPLAPRRLSNGEWALVLPGNFTLADNEAYNASAFRITWPTNSSEVDVEQHNLRQQVVSSPLSSSVSDMSSEDYNCRMDVEAAVKTEHAEFGCVWRPW